MSPAKLAPCWLSLRLLSGVGVVLLTCALLLRCAPPPAIVGREETNDEHRDFVTLLDQRTTAEREYIWVLGNLERYPTDRKMLRSQDSLKNVLRSVEFKLIEKRKFYEESIRLWEEKVLEARLEKEMTDRVIRERRNIKEQ